MYTFIINSCARDGQSRGQWQKAEPYVLAAFPDARVFYPDSPQETMDCARLAADSQYNSIVAVGGEGTMNRVLQGIMDSPHRIACRMGVIPLGNVNDYTNNLGIRKDWRHALEVLQFGKTRKVGLVELSTDSKSDYALNIADLGLGATTTRRHDYGELSWLKGRLKYHLLALKTLMSWENIPAHLLLDGEEMETNVAMLLGGYSPTLAGFRVLPHARVDHDKMAVTIGHNLTRSEMWRLMNDAKRGRLVESDKVNFFHLSHLVMEAHTPFTAQVDGEICDARTIRVEMHAHPQCLDFFSP